MLVNQKLIKDSINISSNKSIDYIMGVLGGIVVGLVASGMDEREAFDIVMLPPGFKRRDIEYRLMFDNSPKESINFNNTTFVEPFAQFK
jgi:hypothetical protein